MITLPNGDKWIIDDREYKGVSNRKRRNGQLPETSIRDFIEELIDPQNHCLPRKLTKDFGGYWDCNFAPYSEILGAIAIKKIKNAFSEVYEMPWGDILVNCLDAYSAIARFSNREEYTKAVTTWSE